MTDSSSRSAQHCADPNKPDPDFINWLRENCVPIAGASFGAVLLCLMAHYSSITIDWSRTKDFTGVVVNVTQSLALIAGGVWAYFKFAKGRTFRDRLIPTVSGKLVSINHSWFLVVTTQLQNVGLSRISFDQASSLVVAECVSSEAAEVLNVQNNRLTSLQVFGAKDRSIEPNEIVERQCLIALPRLSMLGYHVELEVVADSGDAWRTTTIVHNSTFEDNELG